MRWNLLLIITSISDEMQIYHALPLPVLLELKLAKYLNALLIVLKCFFDVFSMFVYIRRCHDFKYIKGTQRFLLFYFVCKFIRNIFLMLPVVCPLCSVMHLFSHHSLPWNFYRLLNIISPLCWNCIIQLFPF